MPLADRVRPNTFDEICGQTHLLAKNAPLRRILDSGHLPSLIFYGPPGTGKTTTADLIAKHFRREFYKLNATTAGTSDVKEILNLSGGLMSGNEGILLYIDEIQYFNKKQQQSLLEYVEDGRVTLICSTTENPYFAIYPALLSRSSVFEFKPVDPKDLIPGLRRAFDILNGDFGNAKTCSDAALEVLAYGCGGDVRKAIGSLENCYYASETAIDEDLARSLAQRSGMRYDRDGQSHYDLLSALQKSIRGSDPDAAVFYLAKILAGGDLVSACRRISVCAAEDIGLAYPNAVIFTKSCIDIALQVGLPEARIPLADAVILLATSPKSNSGEAAIDAAMATVEAGKGTMVPAHLRDQNRPGSEGGYKYPHAFLNHWVRQQYLPDDLAGKTFYTPGENKTERAADEYWQKIKK